MSQPSKPEIVSLRDIHARVVSFLQDVMAEFPEDDLAHKEADELIRLITAFGVVVRKQRPRVLEHVKPGTDDRCPSCGNRRWFNLVQLGLECTTCGHRKWPASDEPAE